MKKYLYFPFIILSMLIALAGCSKYDVDLPEPTIKGLTPLASNTWVSDAKSQQDKGYDPQVMIVIFSLDNLPVPCSTEDITAAFAGDQCRYAVKVQTYQGKMYGNVVMYRNDTDGNNLLSFNIRHYSNKEKGYFTSTPITFVPNETLGSITEPYNLNWVVE